MTQKTENKRFPGIVRFIIMLFQVILYLPIQVIFIPFAIVGLIVGQHKAMNVSRKLGISFSAAQALQYRWFMHYFEARPDPVSIAFIKNFPCESHFGLLSTFGALILSQRVFGFTTKFGKVDDPGEETMFSTASRRVLAFDSIVEKYLDTVDQIVLPGVGFDMIALRYTRGKDVKVFELDQTKTIEVKVKTLRQAGVPHDWITYIPVDYTTESWVEKLLEAGFDRTKKTLFLWESVSLFLQPDVVKGSLRAMADLCVDGSVIAQDFYSKTYVSGKSMTVRKASGLMAKMGEPWIFGIDMANDADAAVGSFLEECGLKMTDSFQFGWKLNVEPYYCIVEAVKR